MSHVSLDKHHTRFTLIQGDSNDASLNWVFLPGGPGMDSRYLSSLTTTLDLPGNIWHIDLPNNGSNMQTPYALKDFDGWADALLQAVKSLSHVIYVGHSFSAMFPFLLPELEQHLKGMVLMCSAPAPWVDASFKKAKTLGLPDLSSAFEAYRQDPKAHYDKTAFAMLDYWFTPKAKTKGATLLKNLPANPFGPLWWMQTVQTHTYPQVIPQNIPCLILGGEQDACTPFELFDDAKDFHRDNIQLQAIPNAAHFPWIEAPEIVKAAFSAFSQRV